MLNFKLNLTLSAICLILALIAVVFSQSGIVYSGENPYWYYSPGGKKIEFEIVKGTVLIEFAKEIESSMKSQIFSPQSNLSPKGQAVLKLAENKIDFEAEVFPVEVELNNSQLAGLYHSRNKTRQYGSFNFTLLKKRTGAKSSKSV